MSWEDAIAPYAALSALLSRQLEITPQHARGLRKRFDCAGAPELRAADQLADRIARVAGDDLDTVLGDYDFICKVMFKEELNFRRTGRYRLTAFAEALDEVYSDQEFMHRYMNGLLITQAWWSNHTEIFQFYQETYLTGFESDFDHLEIGPGHGLLLLEAAQSSRCRSMECWDVSQASIDQTKHALSRLGLQKPVTYHLQDLFMAGEVTRTFDSIVVSEVLEHLEQPDVALTMIKGLLKPGGKVFVNMPVNSPAPDHIYLLREPEEVLTLVEQGGFRILQSQFAPQTGLSLDRARQTKSTISVAVVAQLG